MDCSPVRAEDVCVLTDFRKKDNRVENQVISVTPSKLKFPFNNPLVHSAAITVWNKTKENVRFRILLPQTDVFQVYCDQVEIFSNSEITIYVKCKPRDVQICVDCLEIQVPCQKGIRIPLEVLPSVDWFVLPKFLTLPIASLDKRVDVKVNLPIPYGNQVFDFCILSPLNQYFSVQPRCGKIGGSDGVTSLLVSFQSHEYVTLTYKLQIRFPGTESPPYEIQVFGRCVPNLDNEQIRKDVACIESLNSELSEKKEIKPKEPKFRLKGNGKKEKVSTTDGLDLFTPGGIMKFLIQRGSKGISDGSMYGPLGVPMPKSLSMYHQKRQEFNNDFNRSDIQQAHLAFQHSKERIGDEAIDAHPEKIQEIKHQREQWQAEYAKATGAEPNNPADLTRAELVKLNQRSVRPAGPLPKPKFGVGNNFTDEQFLKDLYRVKRSILQPFVQAARVVITRWRANERLKKLALLKKQILEARQEAAGKVQPETEMKPRPYDCNGPRGEYPSKKDYETAKVIEKLRAKELRNHLDHINNQLGKLHNKLNNDLEQIKTTLKSSPPYDSDYETAEEEEEHGAGGGHSVLDLLPHLERINDTINRLQSKISNGDIAVQQQKINNELLNILGFSPVEKLPPVATSDASKISFQELSAIMADVNGAIDDAQKLISSPVVNQIQYRINSIVDSLPIPGKPMNYFSRKYNKDLVPQIGVLSSAQLDELQKNINTAMRKLQKKLRSSKLQALQDAINAEINSLKGYDSSTLSAGVSDTLADDNEPADVRSLLNEVNVELEKLQSQIENAEIDTLHSRVNSLVADVLRERLDETNFQKKYRLSREIAHKISPEELLYHLKKINDDIDKLSEYDIDFGDILISQSNINDEILSLLEAKGVHTDKISVPFKRPTVLKSATIAELKHHRDLINEDINDLQEKLNNPVIASSLNRIMSIFNKLINPEINPKDLRDLRESVNEEIDQLQDLVNHHPAIEEERKKFNDELARILNTGAHLPENVLTHLNQLNKELDKLQLSFRNPVINQNQFETNKIVEELLHLPKKDKNSVKYLAKQREMTQDVVEIPLAQLKDHRKRISSEFRNLLEHLSDPRIESYHRSINDEIFKALKKYSKPKSSSLETEAKAQLRKISEAVRKLQKKVDNPVINETTANIRRILSAILEEFIASQHGSISDKDLQKHQDQINQQINAFRDKISNESLDAALEAHQVDINQEIDKLSGKHTSIQSRKGPKSDVPVTKEDLMNHKEGINDALQDLLDKVDNPVIDKNRRDINSIMDGLLKQVRRSLKSYKSSLEERENQLDAEKKVIKTIMDLFHLGPQGQQADKDDTVPEVATDEEEKAKLSPNDIGYYQDRLNELYAKVLDNQPNLGIYQNQLKLNEAMDLLKGATKEDDRFRPKPLFDISQQLRDLSVAELKQIQKDYNATFDELEAHGVQDADLEKLKDEFNDMIQNMIKKQRRSSKSSYADPDLLRSRFKSIDRELQSLQEILPESDVDFVREEFHDTMTDLIKARHRSFKADGIPPVDHIKLEDINPSEIEAHRRRLNSQFARLIQETMDPDIAKEHRELNHAINMILEAKKAQDLTKKMSASEVLANLKGLNDGFNNLRGMLGKRKLTGIQNDLNDAVQLHLKKSGIGSFSATHFPEFPQGTPGHDVTMEELMQHQKELNRYFDNLKPKMSTNTMEGLQDRFNDQIASLITRHNIDQLSFEDPDAANLQELQKVNQMVQDLKNVLRTDPELNRIAAGIDKQISKLAPRISRSPGGLPKNLTPRDLEKIRKKIKKHVENVPPELISPELQKLLDELDDWFDTLKEKLRPEVKKMIPEFNREFEKLQDMVGNLGIAGIQEDINTELFRLMDLPLDDALIEQIKHRPFRPSKDLPSDLSVEKLKAQGKRINDVLENLPKAYRNSLIKDIQGALKDKIAYLVDRIELKKGLELVDIYIKEIDNLQDIMMSGDIADIEEKLQEGFTTLLKLEPNHWKKFKDRSFEKVSEVLRSPNQLAKLKDQIIKAFKNIPSRFVTPRIAKQHKKLIDLIRDLTKKAVGANQRALEDELGNDISDLQERISKEIRNLRNKIFTEFQELQSSKDPLDVQRIEKTIRKLKSEILALKDKLSFEMDKLYRKVKNNNKLKKRLQHLQDIKKLHNATDNGIDSLMKEVDDLFNSLKTKVAPAPKKAKVRGKKIKPKAEPPIGKRLVKVCNVRGYSQFSVSTSTSNIPHRVRTCYYIETDGKIPEKVPDFGISLPNSDSRLITPIPSFLDKQKLRALSQAEKCAFNLSSRSAEKLVQELRKINR